MTAEPGASVAVIIVSYGGADDLPALAAALERQSPRPASVHICENAGRGAFERLVAALSDGARRTSRGPSDETAAVVVESVTILRAGGLTMTCHRARGNLGYAGGINACIGQLAEEAWSSIWIINPDAVPDPGALAALSDRLQAGDCGVVGGRVIFAETGRVQTHGGIWRKWMARGLNIDFGAPESHAPDAKAIEGRMDYVSGACMLVSRAFYDAVGPMDEDYFLYCEEVDWCARRGAFKLGFAPGAIIRHDHGKLIGSHRDRRRRSRLSVYLDERNKLLFTRRNHSAIYPLVALATLALLSQYLVHGAFANFAHAFAGWLAGAAGETGVPPWFAAQSGRDGRNPERETSHHG
jgi:N-acetylglucosaminyl-diphospho-decaprenol L-rhamnosyltransferase